MDNARLTDNSSQFENRAVLIWDEQSAWLYFIHLFVRQFCWTDFKDGLSLWDRNFRTAFSDKIHAVIASRLGENPTLVLYHQHVQNVLRNEADCRGFRRGYLTCSQWKHWMFGKLIWLIEFYTRLPEYANALYNFVKPRSGLVSTTMLLKISSVDKIGSDKSNIL